MLAATSRVVTIDGPAGTGKSTVARELARRLGFTLLDTGAMYRAVALAALRESIPLDDGDALAALAARTTFLQTEQSFFLQGADVTAVLRTPEVSQAASRVAAVAGVRVRLVDWQRRAASERGTVTEGRDQGTVVFPDAPAKFFLTALPTTRARRRFDELAAKHGDVRLDDVLREQDERDRRDAEREVGPMRPAADALIIDTSDLSIDEVTDTLERTARFALGEGHPPTHSRLWRARVDDQPALRVVGGSRAAVEATVRAYLGQVEAAIEPPQL